MPNKRLKDEQDRKIRYNCSLSTWLVNWLKAQRNASQIVEQAVIKQNNLKEPEE